MSAYMEPTPIAEALGSSCRDLGGTVELAAVAHDLRVNGVSCEQSAPAPAQPAVQPQEQRNDFAGLIGAKPQTLTR